MIGRLPLLLALSFTSALFGQEGPAGEAFFQAEAAYRHADYAKAAEILERFWSDHPAGGEEWRSRAGERQTLANFGTPAFYSALRMLSDCVDWRLHASPVATHNIRLTMILVGRSHGIQPSSMSELRAKTGNHVSHSLATIRPEWIDQATYLFTEYVRAVTGGRIAVEVQTLKLPALDVGVEVFELTQNTAGVSRNRLYAGLEPGPWDKIWSAAPADIRAATDWWWVVYPSHVPEQFPDFARAEFISGGMSVGPDGQSPAFICDDLWLVRIPPHLGHGLYTEEQRRAWFPQWLQHEFFHHLYRTFPELRLEAASHQWFDRATWPVDFKGFLEADYYSESLHKRLQSATPPLHVALRYAAPSPSVWRAIAPDALLGEYRSVPTLNNWLEGTISGAETLRWTNSAGVSWLLTPDIPNGVLHTGQSNPYYASQPLLGREFRIVLRRSPDGEYLPEVSGFLFLGAFYAKVGVPK